MTGKLSTPILTPRLLIRLVERDDLEALFAMHTDTGTTRYIPHMRWATWANAEAWFERDLERRRTESAVQCVIVRRATDDACEAVVGTAVLFNFEMASGLAEIGYLLGREHWGKGYAVESVSAFIEFVFSTLNLRRLEAAVDTRNAGSNQLLQRLGFTLEGVLRERWLASGELQDINLFALLKREWQSAPAT